MKPKVVVVALVLLLGAGVAFADEPASESQSKDEEFMTAVREFWAKYTSAALAGDAATVISMWDENCVKMAPSSTMAEGIDRVRSILENRFKNVRYETIDLRVTGVHVENDYGFAYGYYHWALRFKRSGSLEERYAKYLTVFRRQPDGTWKIFLDSVSYNSQ